MWQLTSTNQDLLNRIINDEGTQAYQAHTGTFKNGKFIQYKDTVGKNTIGYGHLVLVNESFKGGLTPDEASTLLSKDLVTAVQGATAIYNQYKLNAPLSVQIILTALVFQIEKGGLLKFKDFLGALQKNDFKTAAAELKDSKLFTQAPNRIQNYMNTLRGI